MSIKVEINKIEVEEISGNAKATGKPFAFTKQVGWLHGSDPYPTRFEFIVDSPSKALQPGFYALDENSVYVDRNGRLAINPKLNPIVKDSAEYAKK